MRRNEYINLGKDGVLIGEYLKDCCIVGGKITLSECVVVGCVIKSGGAIGKGDVDIQNCSTTDTSIIAGCLEVTRGNHDKMLVHDCMVNLRGCSLELCKFLDCLTSDLIENVRFVRCEIEVSNDYMAGFNLCEFDTCQISSDVHTANCRYSNCTKIYAKRIAGRCYEFGEWEGNMVSGCRSFSVKEAIDHWSKASYPDKDRAGLYIALVEWFDKRGK